MNGKLEKLNGEHEKLNVIRRNLNANHQKLNVIDNPRQNGFEAKQSGIEARAEERHNEILGRFTALERDQDFIWEKTARNEREIGNIKRQIDSLTNTSV